MTFVNGEVQARFMARIRGVDPQRCLAIPVDVGKATAVALVADHYGEIIVAPFEFALIEAGFAVLSAAITRAQLERDALVVRIGVEAAGHYHRTLVARLRAAGLEVVELNPKAVKDAVIDGVPDGMFAIYTKTHHSIIDGESGLKRIYEGLSTSDQRTVPTPAFALRAPEPAPHPPTLLTERIADSIRGAVTQVEALNQVSVSALRKVLAGLFGSHLEGSLPFAAQHAPTNVPLKIGRRFATLSLPLEEMHKVGRHFGANLNDVAVTVVDAGLHAYLRETGRAFGHPFIAMCPVSLRADGDTAVGTRVSAMFARLGEPGASVSERIRQVVDSVAACKKELGHLSNEAAMTYAVGLVTLAGLGASTHLDRVAHPACNLVVSNVAGAKETRYLNGARLLGIYPVSALAASIGLNATLASYHDSMDFGFVANAAALDDLPRLARCTQQAYEELKEAAGLQLAHAKRASS